MIAEFAAYRALVETVEGLPTVYDTLIQPGEHRPPMYVVLFDQTPRRGATRLDGRATSSSHTFSLMGVGTSPGEVRWLMQETRPVLEGARLEVGDRVSTPLKKIGGSQILPPEKGDPLVYTATDVWRCGFDRA